MYINIIYYIIYKTNLREAFGPPFVFVVKIDKKDAKFFKKATKKC